MIKHTTRYTGTCMIIVHGSNTKILHQHEAFDLVEGRGQPRWLKNTALSYATCNYTRIIICQGSGKENKGYQRIFFLLFLYKLL